MAIQPQPEQTDDIQSEGEEPEFRIYVESNAGEPVLSGIRGQRAMELAVEQTCDMFPEQSVYVREVTEKVVLVVRPDRSITTFS